MNWENGDICDNCLNSKECVWRKQNPRCSILSFQKKLVTYDEFGDKTVRTVLHYVKVKKQIPLVYDREFYDKLFEEIGESCGSFNNFSLVVYKGKIVECEAYSPKL